MAEDAPSARYILKKRAVDSGNVRLARIDENNSLHAGKNLLHAGGRLVLRVRAEFESHQWIARLPQTHLARIGAVVFVQESVWQRLQDAHGAFGIFFLFPPFAVQL